jgi:hypothetical protein
MAAGRELHQECERHFDLDSSTDSGFGQSLDGKEYHAQRLTRLSAMAKSLLDV